MPTMNIALNEEAVKQTLRRIAENEASDIADGSMMMKLIWLKEDLPKLFLFPSLTDGHSRDALAWAVTVLSSVVDADHLVHVADSYGTTSRLRTNGEPWGLGDMEYAAKHQTEDAHLIHEQLTYTIVSREGWCANGCVPYDRVGDEVRFRWDDMRVIVEDVDTPTAYAGGYFPDMMRNAMAADRPETIQHILDLGPRMGLSPEASAMHALCAAVKLVGMKVGVQMAIAATSEVEANILKESFKGLGGEMVGPGEDD